MFLNCQFHAPPERAELISAKIELNNKVYTLVVALPRILRPLSISCNQLKIHVSNS
jgi:hypothetical protein